MTRKKQNNIGGIVYSTNNNFKPFVEAEEINTLVSGDQKAVIKLDKKQRGGKIVTLIEGLQMTPADLEGISKQLKTLCGTGGSAKNGEIIIQGDHREKILQWMVKKGYTRTKKI